MSKEERLVKDGFLNVRKSAEYLGVSKTAVYDLIRSNTISHARIRGLKVIPIVALHEYAAQRITIGKVA